MKIIKTVLALTMFTLLTIFTTASFAAQPDSVLSGDIKEADGTSGQDTNSGSGIKTGHIQDSAVTNDKIADGAVNAQKLGAFCPEGYYLQYSSAIGWACRPGLFGRENRA